MGEPDVTPDDGIVTDGDTAKDGGIGIHGDVVLNDGMSWHIDWSSTVVCLEILGTECHTLIEGNRVANDTCLTDDYTRTMVDGKYSPISAPGWMSIPVA